MANSHGDQTKDRLVRERRGDIEERPIAFHDLRVEIEEGSDDNVPSLTVEGEHDVDRES
jgi:hypothetical protein